jgi:hypothetical protein
VRPDPTLGRFARRAPTLLLAAVLLLLALAAAGCDMPSTGGLGQVYGSGTPATKTYDFTGFTKVTVDSGFVATVDYGEDYAVSVSVDDNLVKEHLKVELEGDTLHIGLAPLWQYRDVTLRATVTLPLLTRLEVSGSSRVDGVATGDDLELAVSGSSTATLKGSGKVDMDVSGASRVDGEVRWDELNGEVSGASIAAFGGTADALRLDVSGGSRLDLMDLLVQTADLTLSGGSRGEVMVQGALNVEASGGSTLEYAGDPQLGAVDVSGGSAVEPAAE